MTREETGNYWVMATFFYYCYYYTAFVSRHVSHQFGNAKAQINKHTHVKSITKKFNKKSIESAIKK